MQELGSKWVAKAKADEFENREYLRYLYCDGVRLFASDGARVHMINCNLAEGYYDAEMNPTTASRPYPDIGRLIPVKGPVVALNLKELPVIKWGEIEAYVLPNGLHVNRRFLNAASANRKTGVNYLLADNSSVLVMHDCGALAVVMGLVRCMK